VREKFLPRLSGHFAVVEETRDQVLVESPFVSASVPLDPRGELNVALPRSAVVRA
jgi:hypothetical protein